MNKITQTMPQLFVRDRGKQKYKKETPSGPAPSILAAQPNSPGYFSKSTAETKNVASRTGN